MQPYSDRDDEKFVQRLFQILLRRSPDQDVVAHYVTGLQSGRTHLELIEESCASDEYAFRLGAPLYVTPGHFYSPIVNPNEVEKHVNWHADHVAEMLPGIKIDRGEMVTMWQKLLPFFREQLFAEKVKPGFRYGFDNTAFSWGDGRTVSPRDVDVTSPEKSHRSRVRVVVGLHGRHD